MRALLFMHFYECAGPQKILEEKERDQPMPINKRPTTRNACLVAIFQTNQIDYYRSDASFFDPLIK